MSEAPDLVEPIVAFRQWRLRDGMLYSPYSGEPWTSAEMRGTCAWRRHAPSEVPAKGCSCGIYAQYDQFPLTASAGTPDFVNGAVIVWGTVELHGTGLRAAAALIVALELPLSRGRKRRELLSVGEALGIRCVSHRQLTAAALAHGHPLQIALRPPRVWAVVDSRRRALPWTAPSAGARINGWGSVIHDYGRRSGGLSR